MADVAPKQDLSKPLLLNERMKSFGLSPAAIEKSSPVVMQGLQHACASCALKARCRQDMTSERHAADVASYCPNEQTLQALRKT